MPSLQISADMAIPQSLHLYLLATFLFALPFMGTSSHHHHHNHRGLKYLNFTLYQHGVLNKTGDVIVNGVTGPGLTNITAPFGTLYDLHDPITTSSNSSSKVAGSVEGFLVTSSFDGLSNMALYKITLQLKSHKGSIIIVGNIHALKPSVVPVVGGDGDFLFVQGYVTTTLLKAEDFPYLFKIEFLLYWPPYLDQATFHH